MAKLQYDKRQLPVVVGMGALSIGLFGFFVWKMTTPPPLQAAPAPGTTAASAGSIGNRAERTAQANQNAAPIPLPGVANGQPSLYGAPSPDLRDPFAPAIVDPTGVPGKPPVQMAMANEPKPGNLPSVPNLPPASIAPLSPLTPGSAAPGRPSAQSGPSGPSWTVTGVLSEPTDPQNRVAILRSGDVRRFVRLGDMVDGNFRLTSVSRQGVVLTDGAQHYHLILGGNTKKSAIGRNVSSIDDASLNPPDKVAAEKTTNSFLADYASGGLGTNLFQKYPGDWQQDKDSLPNQVRNPKLQRASKPSDGNAWVISGTIEFLAFDGDWKTEAFSIEFASDGSIAKVAM